MDDRFDQMARSLQNIERAVANGAMGGSTTENVFSGRGVASQTGTLQPSKYVIRETDDLDGVSSGGTVTLSPGDTETIVDARARDSAMALLAVGANDATGVEYRLKVDDSRVVGGTTHAPLGVVNDPFSFVEEFGAVIPVEKYVEYEASYDSSQTGEVDIVGRLHVEQL